MRTASIMNTIKNFGCERLRELRSKQKISFELQTCSLHWDKLMTPYIQHIQQRTCDLVPSPQKTKQTKAKYLQNTPKQQQTIRTTTSLRVLSKSLKGASFTYLLFKWKDFSTFKSMK